MVSREYVHGYSDRETQRLQEQSLILEELLHAGTFYPPGSSVLEVGCGVGAQTLILLRRNPGIRLTSVDMSEESLQKAKARVGEMGHDNVEFRHEDILDRDWSRDPLTTCLSVSFLSIWSIRFSHLNK